MSKKTYAEECIERANAATEGPWIVYKTDFADHPDGIKSKSEDDIICGSIQYEQSGINTKETAEFIAHSRVDVPELARRLQLACQELRTIHDYYTPLYKFHEYAQKRSQALVDCLEEGYKPYDCS